MGSRVPDDQGGLPLDLVKHRFRPAIIEDGMPGKMVASADKPVAFDPLFGSAALPFDAKFTSGARVTLAVGAVIGVPVATESLCCA